jgi:acyl-CoA thioester hydrolase
LEPPELHREVIRPEWCDYNGHMNLAFYVLVFDHTTDAFWDLLGIGLDYRNRTNYSTFTVESHITYDREVLEGDEVRCTTQFLGFDDKRLHYFHRMYHAREGYLASTTEILGVHIDLGIRRVAPMPREILARLAETMESHRAFGTPEQAGRVIALGSRRNS